MELENITAGYTQWIHANFGNTLGYALLATAIIGLAVFGYWLMKHCK